MTQTATQDDITTLTTARVEAFSDGVIAIAATLLVLEIRRPEGAEPVWQFLRGQLPTLATYVTSFLAILTFWVNHHALFHAVRRVSRGMLFVNGVLLLAISFVSYATAVVGHALQDGHYARSAAVFYALALAFAALAFVGLWLCLLARPALMTDAARPRLRAALRRSLVGPLLYGLAALVALAYAPASIAIDVLAGVYFSLLPRHLRRRVPEEEAR